jgi:hypothetical protein
MMRNGFLGWVEDWGVLVGTAIFVLWVFGWALGFWLVNWLPARRRKGNPPPYVGGYGNADRATELAARGSRQEPYQGWKYWCLVLLAVLLIGAVGVGPLMYPTGKTLWVDSVNGSDASGRRGVATSPYATLQAAVTNAQAGDTVMTWAGEYNVGTNNILRPGVNYDLTRSTVIWTNTVQANNEAFQGLFDDRLTGATTNYIKFGKIIYYSNPGFLLRGAIVVTNALSELHVSGWRLEGSCETGQLPLQLGGRNAFVHLLSGKNFVDIDELEDTGRYTWGLDEFLATVITNGPAISGIYWEAGEHHVNVKRLSVFAGYGAWGHEPTNNSSGDFHYTGNLIQVVSNGTAGVYVDSSQSVASPNFRSWWRVNELRYPAALGLSLIGLNKVYWEFGGKISGNPAVASSSFLWLNAGKVTGLPQAAALSGGEAHVTVQQWEQGSGTAAPFIAVTGGNNHFIGGYGKVTNSTQALLKVSGGTNLVQGMTLETTGAGNAAPPIFAATNSNLTLEDVVLISGGTNAIAATNIQGVALRGTLTIDRTNGALVQVFGGTTIFSNKVVWPRPYQFMADMGIQRTAFAVHNGTSATFSFIGDAGNFVVAGQCTGTNAEASSGAGLVISTSPTATGLNGMSGNLNYRTGRNCMIERRVTLTNIANVIFWTACLTDGSITNQMTNAPVGFNYAGFRLSTVAVDANWKFCTANAGTQTVTDTGIAADTGNHWFLAQEDSLFGRWYGYIDGICVATNVANVPAANTNLRYVDGIFSTVAATTNGFKLEWVAMGSSK